MIRAIALDDEPLGLKIISRFCEETEDIVLEKTFTQITEAQKFLRKFPVDLIFLDIHMPAKNGIDFYKSLNQEIMVVFTTAYSDYAVEGFNVNAVDYLLKPFSLERFQAAVIKGKNELLARQYTHQHTHLLIRADYKLHRIEFDTIILIESLDDYVQIHLANSTKLVARLSMKTLLEKLPASDFIRVHRSYIVPVQKIQTLKHKTIHIGAFVIPIGDTYKDVISKLL